MASIYSTLTGHKIRDVKNLGWLIRNSSKITHIDVKQNTDENKRHYPVTLRAFTDDNRVYITDWADESVLRDWFFNKHYKLFNGIVLSFLTYGANKEPEIKKYKIGDYVYIQNRFPHMFKRES